MSTDARDSGSDPAEASTDAATALAEVMQAAGTELSEPVRRPLEQLFGASFQHVRLHTDTSAARAAEAWQARALTVGAHVAFDHGEFQPATVAGRRLLAHELAHVVQQSGAPAQPDSDVTWSSTPDDHAEREAERAADAVAEGRTVPPLSTLPAPAVQLDPPRGESRSPAVSRDPLDHPPDARATASLFGLDVVPEAGAMIKREVPYEDQIWAFLLKRLAPNHYRREWIAGAQRHLRATGTFKLTVAPLSRPGPQEHQRLHVYPYPALRILDYLQAEIGGTVPRSSWLNLQPSQVELLELGLEVDIIVRERTPDDLAALGFPAWYSPDIFRADVQSFGTRLRAEAAERAAMSTAAQAGNVTVSNQDVAAAQDALFQAILPAARAAEAIRLEPQLQADPTLRAMWRLEPSGPQTPAAATGAPAPQIVELMRFARTQPGPLRAVNEATPSEPPATVVLFQRFIRFVNRFVPRGEGDANLANTPADRNADPLPAQVAAWPQLEPPNYDAALGTDHLFVLDVSFSDVYEELANHFGGFGYYWEIIQVPAEDLAQIEQTAASPPGTGTEPGWGEVWGARMARQGRYAVADISRSMGWDASGRLVSLTAALGAPPFVGATTAVAANALLRTIGEVISSFFEMLTEPRNERHIVFPHAGLWVVRATCAPVLTDDSEFRRAPSVAWVPVFARSPEMMGRLRMEQTLGAQLQQEMQLTEVLLRLEAQNACGPEWDELARTRDLLSVQLYGSGADLLAQQQQALRARLGEAGLPAATAAVLERQIAAIDEQLQLRADRSGDLRGSERIQVVFVTDTGTVIHPLIEGVATEQPGRASWYLSDITTPNSVDVTGRGTSRDAALMAGLVELFERHTGYGRGELQVFLRDRTNPSQGRIEHRRIEADATALAMESIERITAVVTIAAMVAAPFTGGASLAILLPVGIIGAIPSAYRLADRAENATLRPDMQTLLDVVNIVGAGLGAVGEGAGGLRMVRLQRFAAITGLGIDGLTLLATSYSLLRQIDELPPDMPQGARRAAVMRIVAAELQTVGMMAAGRLVGHANAMEQMSRAPGDEPALRSVEGAGAPHVIADPTAGTPRVYGPEAPRRAPSPEFEARLPDDLRGRVRVESDSSLDRGSTEVRYDLDAFGTIREVYIAHGEGAAPDGMTGHATTARQLLALTTFGARLRTFYNRLRLALGGTAPPQPGTEAFNAQFEVPKLRDWLTQRQEAAAQGRIDAEQLAAERALYEDQMAYYEHLLDVFHRTGQAGGESSAVAARSRVLWTREQLRSRFGLGQGDLPKARPAGWRGEHEAAWRGYPQAEPNYQWRMDQPGNRLTYQRSPGAPADTPRRAFDAANGQFVTVRNDISAVSLDAVREGLPPPPADHHYRYYEATQSWELALNDGAADRGVTPLTLQERANAPGNYDFVPRPEGAGTLIRRPPYRTDVALGSTRPSDLLASPETRARYEELLNRRDAALRAREAAREALPPEPDPADSAAHAAWEELPAVREYLRLRNQVGTASRDIGTFAADAHVRRTWPGASRVHPPEGAALTRSSSGDFDLVYQLPDGRMIVVEAKGGSGTLGSRQVSGERGVSAQQGTAEYYQEIVSSMARRSGSEAEAAALLLATSSSKVLYLHIESPISTAASGQPTSEVGALRVNAFDLSRPGLRPITPAAVP